VPGYLVLWPRWLVVVVTESRFFFVDERKPAIRVALPLLKVDGRFRRGGFVLCVVVEWRLGFGLLSVQGQLLVLGFVLHTVHRACFIEVQRRFCDLDPCSGLAFFLTVFKVVVVVVRHLNKLLISTACEVQDCYPPWRLRCDWSPDPPR
jgi:hypothetical protein